MATIITARDGCCVCCPNLGRAATRAFAERDGTLVGVCSWCADDLVKAQHPWADYSSLQPIVQSDRLVTDWDLW